MSTVQARILAVLRLPLSVPAFLKVCAAIIAGLTNNAFFPNAAAIVAALTKAFVAVDTAETAVKTRAKGTVPARNAARTAMVAELQAAKIFVQQTADADPEHAEAIITSAGMSTRKANARNKAPLAVVQGAVSGAVHVRAKAVARRASYDWQWSNDGGKTWVDLPQTLQAKTTLAGIPVGLVVQFRFRAVTITGVGDWSPGVSLLVK
jgi:hypothetical protein